MKKIKIAFSFAIFSPFCGASKAQAQLKIPALFSDNMVLQQQSHPQIWGWSTANSKVSVTVSWGKEKFQSNADKDGKWKIQLSTPSAGGPYLIHIQSGSSKVDINNVLIGEVWLCTGQSNMEMPMKGFRDTPIANSADDIMNSKNSKLHFIKIPRSSQTVPQDSAKYSQWMEATPGSVSNFSATGYYFGRMLQKMLDVPVGLISVNYGGSKAEAWMDSAVLASVGDIKIPQRGDAIKSVNQTPTVLFNGMLRPVIGYGIKGCIWYQGESNYDNPKQYETLFPTMVHRWRELWGQGDFPFYFAQIAPFNYASLPPYYSGGKYNSAFLRDAQRKSLKTIPNSAMVSLMDIGEEDNIHPKHKKEGGERFAFLALDNVYGMKDYTLACPTYDSMVVAGNVVTLHFLNTRNGLTSYGKPLQQFEIAGADKVFHPANAVITQGKLKVSSPYVAAPVAVRYAFKDFVVGDLFNTEGLPMASFRTDDWDY